MTTGTQRPGPPAGAAPAADPMDRILGARGAWWGRVIGWVLTRVVWPTRLSGVGDWFHEGPYILAINHINVVDGPVVFGRCPRRTHFLVKKEMFRGIAGWALSEVGQIPIDRDGFDRRALGAAVRALKEGRVVGIFPEGARGRGDVAAVRQGIAWIGLTSAAPVVPVAVLGTRRSGQRTGAVPRAGRRLRVVFGTPFTLTRPEGVPGRDALALAAEQVRVQLATHVHAAAAATGTTLPEDSGGES